MRDDRMTRQLDENTAGLGARKHSCYNLNGDIETNSLPSSVLDTSSKKMHKSKKKYGAGRWSVESDIDMSVAELVSMVNEKEKQYISDSVESKDALAKIPSARTLKDKPSNTESDGGESDNNQNRNARQSKAYQMALDLMREYYFVNMDEQLYLFYEAEGYWKIIKESESNRAIRRMILGNQRHYVNKQNLSEVYEWLLTLSNVAIDLPEVRRHIINFRDCALDWSTGEIFVDRREYYFKYALRINYEDAALMRNGKFNEFVTDIFGDDDETKREFGKFLGLCLSDIRDLKLSMFLYGPSNTGKSVLLNLLRRIVGPEWCASLSFTQMSNEFAITQLLGKRLNLSGEVSGTSNKRLDIFKSLTGNDDVTACFKTKDHFQFKNESLLVFACNSFPPINALEEFESFLSRIVIFPFLRVKPRNEWIDKLDELLLADSASVIEMATVGLRELEADDFCFIETEAMRQSKREYIGKYNSFALFAEDYIVSDPDSVVTSNQIREQYKIFCRNEGYVALSDNVWSPYLKQKYVCRARTVVEKTDMGERRSRGYQGIRLSATLKLETATEIIPWMEDLACY